MSEGRYFAERALQELKAAMKAPNLRARRAHLMLADTYTAKLMEAKLEMANSEQRPARLKL
jgi:hypothetical protein